MYLHMYVHVYEPSCMLLKLWIIISKAKFNSLGNGVLNCGKQGQPYETRALREFIIRVLWF